MLRNTERKIKGKETTKEEVSVDVLGSLKHFLLVFSSDIQDVQSITCYEDAEFLRRYMS